MGAVGAIGMDMDVWQGRALVAMIVVMVVDVAVKRQRAVGPKPNSDGIRAPPRMPGSTLAADMAVEADHPVGRAHHQHGGRG